MDDPLGRRWVSNDPNLGTTQFTYNGLGELLTQTDARNRKLTFQYDALGRNTERKTSGGDEFGSGANKSGVRSCYAIFVGLTLAYVSSSAH